MDPEAALQVLDAQRAGLDAAQAAERLARHGPNALPTPPRPHALQRLLAQFNNALILFLLGAAVVAGALGHWVDAGVILGVVLVNAIVGFVQEGKAEEALGALRAMLAPNARVLRDGVRLAVPVASLVPGDLVLLEAGDRVPADLRLLRARGLLVDEAILTGESVASSKTEAAVDAQAALGDRADMVYGGTLVAAGAGQGLVVATGVQTEIGRISSLLGAVQPLATPLLRKIDAFGRRFTLLSLALAAVLLAFAVGVQGMAWLPALMVVVAIAVSLVPESLPAVITITLAIGVRRMAARQAIVRRLPAVETLGATTVICSDKTGTLTRNEMTACRVVAADACIAVGGSGYAPVGALDLPAGQDALPAHARLLVEAALLCNDAQLLQDAAGQWKVDGDPMEGALVALAMKAGLAPAALRAGQPRSDEIPFDAQHRFMATLHAQADGQALLYVKGAPERVLAMSTQQLGAGGQPCALDAAHWQQAVAEAASAGERVLGFALRRLPGTSQSAPTSAPAPLDFGAASELVFLGLVGFIDPPRAPDAPLLSPFMLWRIVFVSLLFTAGAFGIFAWAGHQGYEDALGRTMVVNTLCAMEVFYLFNVRYLHMRSFTWTGARGTPAVLWAVGAVVLAQLAFTYTPWMQALFDTRAVPLADGVLIVAIGAASMVVLEIEKALLRRWQLFEELKESNA